MAEAKEKKRPLELGFGNKSLKESSRFLNKDGSVNIQRLDGDFLYRIDFYHSLITMPWRRFLLMVLTGYLVINLVFAGLYYWAGAEHFGNLAGVDASHKFMELFFFSAQTLTTVGYGYIYPKGPMVSTIAAIESMAGLMMFALATGVLYGRFSKPQAHIRYSKNCLIAPYEGIKGFMFRVANATQNELIESEVQVILVMNDKEGKRQFLPLPLEVNKISFMALTWTIVHPIDEQSPLRGMSKQDIIAADAEFLILLKAINDTYSQTVYSRSSYKGSEIVENAKFKLMERSFRHGKTTIDLRRIDDMEMVA